MTGKNYGTESSEKTAGSNDGSFIQVWKSSVKGMVLRNGKLCAIPEGWIFVKRGDAALTRRIKKSSECWLQVYQHKNRLECAGLYAPEVLVNEIRNQLTLERQDPSLQKKREAARRYRAVQQKQYEAEFFHQVLTGLDFHPQWQNIARTLAYAVTVHAVPVGSGTVARTGRIPLSDRAAAAVIAWMRHQTTAYDNTPVARIRGARRKLRHHLALDSKAILAQYRTGDPIDLEKCPLYAALKKVEIPDDFEFGKTDC